MTENNLRRLPVSQEQSRSLPRRKYLVRSKGIGRHSRFIRVGRPAQKLKEGSELLIGSSHIYESRVEVQPFVTFWMNRVIWDLLNLLRINLALRKGITNERYETQSIHQAAQ